MPSRAPLVLALVASAAAHFDVWAPEHLAGNFVDEPASWGPPEYTVNGMVALATSCPCYWLSTPPPEYGQQPPQSAAAQQEYQPQILRPEGAAAAPGSPALQTGSPALPGSPAPAAEQPPAEAAGQ